MRNGRVMRLGALGAAAMSLSGCVVADYGGGYSDYSAPPAAYTDQDNADDYEWIDRADSLWEAIGDAPPDYAFDFEGEQPWAWQTVDGYTIVVEDADEDGIRSYYFAPGADGPFLAVEPGLSFGYDGERVSVVYGADGGALPRTEGGQYLDEAMALFARGHRLRTALSGRQWQSVDADAWIDASPYIFGFIQVWDEGKRRHPGWSRYHDRVRADAWRWRFEEEQRRRRGLSDQFRRWREGGFHGTPPGRFHRRGEGTGAHQPGTGRPHGPGTPPRRPPNRPDTPGQPQTNPWSVPPQPGAGNGAAPGRPGRPDRPRPWPRPAPQGEAPVVVQPAPGTPAPQPPVARPPRPEGGWQGPRRPRPPVPQPSTGDDSSSAPQPPVTRPSRWNGGSRPEGSGASNPPPPRPNWTPQPRSEPRSSPPPRSAPPRSSPPSRPAPPPRPAPPAKGDTGDVPPPSR